jgi:hypothetical protein
MSQPSEPKTPEMDRDPVGVDDIPMGHAPTLHGVSCSSRPTQVSKLNDWEPVGVDMPRRYDCNATDASPNELVGDRSADADAIKSDAKCAKGQLFIGAFFGVSSASNSKTSMKVFLMDTRRGSEAC